jgi:pantoate--beta-alanine ligase
MILYKRGADLHKYIDIQRGNEIKIAFVPTMGALHEGHISLVSEARQSDALSVCSIFVNPTQFNDPADYKKYPITLEKDMAALEEAGCDVLFLPSVDEMYPYGTDEKFHYDIGYLETILEGKYRPGHFQGVCRVVHRLLEIVEPDQLYLGQKDYQQCLVIKRLLQLTGLDQSIRINISPTLREKNGLAMSSRNMRLDEGSRKKAMAIHESLSQIRKTIHPGLLTALKEQAVLELAGKGFKPDYIEIADAGNLSLVNHWDGKQKLVALAAASLNDVRLIDNILLN